MKKILNLLIFSLLSSTTLMASEFRNTCQFSADTLKKENYTIYGKSAKVAKLEISKSKRSLEQVITIRFGYPNKIANNNSLTSTAVQGGISKSTGSLPEIKNVMILKGKYQDMTAAMDGTNKIKYTLTGLSFPLHLKIFSVDEVAEFELKEPGKWNIELELKNN